jgi:carbohydrate-binding DOMON domain-containing protein
MDTLYASVAAAAPVWDAGGAWVGAPAAAVLAAYYSVLAPQRASQRACLEMMQPSVRSLERRC